MARCWIAWSACASAAGNFWFPTGMELAEYCLDNLFQAECGRLRAASG